MDRQVDIQQICIYLSAFPKLLSMKYDQVKHILSKHLAAAANSANIFTNYEVKSF